MLVLLQPHFIQGEAMKLDKEDVAQTIAEAFDKAVQEGLIKEPHLSEREILLTICSENGISSIQEFTTWLDTFDDADYDRVFGDRISPNTLGQVESFGTPIGVMLHEFAKRRRAGVLPKI